MQIDILAQTIALSVGEFADFSPGPVSGSGKGRAGLWRAQLGKSWHDELQKQASAADTAARFEIPLQRDQRWKGWTFRFNGRIDQIVHRNPESPASARIREIKTISGTLPAPEEDLRRDYPAHFRQLSAYQTLADLPENDADLVFVEIASGVTQIVSQSPAQARDVFETQLDALWAWLECRRTGLERLRTLSFQPAFETPRPGQETINDNLNTAAASSPVVLFEAPTGFGKTGCVLQLALEELKAGRATRLIYLTGKSTGQLQVVSQLKRMLGQPAGATWWQVRSKAEHCVNSVYHCFRDSCRYLDGQDERWPNSGLQRFYLFRDQPRDIEAIREAARTETICPYEITRAALPFNDIWIADYNYLFAPANRGFLEALPGFDPAQTLLVIDEAHNLPARVADAHSEEFSDGVAHRTLAGLEHIRASARLIRAWEHWISFLTGLERNDGLDPIQEADLDDALTPFSALSGELALDFAELGPAACDDLFRALDFAERRRDPSPLPTLLWSSGAGTLRETCLDAAPVIAETVSRFGQVLVQSATLSPIDHFLSGCGLDSLATEPFYLNAHAPWRDDAYQVAVDLRVDTRFQHRGRHSGTTAATLAMMVDKLNGPIAVFFPSYGYAEMIRAALEQDFGWVRVATQERGRTLSEQATFLDEALLLNDLLFLVLGSSFSEGVDLLGGRLAAAVIMGPALPEVNAVQHARLARLERRDGRDAAFRAVYRIPGLQKVNQALGRLVREPGQTARILLHCQRFGEPAFNELLAPEYRNGTPLTTDADLAAWLES